MSALLLIEGREAIPVRLIPYITGWTMPPDVVAKSLGHEATFGKLPGLFAYHLHEGGWPKMLPKEWGNVIADIEILTEVLNAKETQEHFPEWRKRAISVLPAGVFVWKDEFVPAFERAYRKARIEIIDERPGDRELNFSPYIPPDMRSEIFEGFAQDQVTSQAKRAPVIDAPPTEPEAPLPIGEHPEGAATLTWEDATLKIADEVGAEQWEMGIREITARGIAENVAKRLAENPRYRGQRGPRDASTIRKALKRWRFTPPDAGASGASGASD